VIGSPALNAFATGRSPSHAAVAVTEGLLQTLDANELRGVIAHELSHVRHRDILIGSIVAVIAGALSMLQWVAFFGGYGRDSNSGGAGALIGLLVAFIAAPLIQFAISRSREYEADAGAARLTGDPTGLISALKKLELGAERVPLGGNSATAHMFIVNPLRGGAVAKLFSTHPPMAERVERLQKLIGVPNL
jgi:heat shock protein HtpX